MHGFTTPSRRPGRLPLSPMALVATLLLLGAGSAPASAQTSPARPRPRPQATAPATDPGSPPGGMVLTPPAEEPKVDPQVEPAQATPPLDEATRPAAAAPADESNPDPPAKVRPGTAPAGGAAPASEGDGFALPTDRLSMGKQDFRLSVEVQQPGPVINLQREATVNLVVKNLGNVEALGVSVVCRMPEGLELVSSVPTASQYPGDKANYYWPKPSLAVGGEWVIPVKVKATKVTACDLGATVTAKAGARARLVVQEPKLRVEQVAEPTRLLRGRQASFRISVSNPGTGPAKNVLVQAKLSEGLRTLDGETTVEQTIPVLAATQTVHLDSLVVDTRAGGAQTCEVVVTSDDVNTSPPEETHSSKTIDVISPELALTLTGPENRYTDQKGEYALVVQNKGTAPAENVKLVVTMPTTGGQLKAMQGEGGQFDRNARKIFWNVGRIEAKEEKKYGFTYLTTGPGLYTTVAEATSGEMRAPAKLLTDVRGLAVVAVRMTSSNRVIDVGDTTIYDIEIRNWGTEDATKVILNGTLSTNLSIEGISGLDGKQVKYNKQDGRILFPEIERIAPGKSVTLSIEAKAKSRGSGMCRIQLDHAALPHGPQASPDDLIHAVAHTTITGESPARTANADTQP